MQVSLGLCDGDQATARQHRGYDGVELDDPMARSTDPDVKPEGIWFWQRLAQLEALRVGIQKDIAEPPMKGAGHEATHLIEALPKSSISRILRLE
jgi:hypothetical protein